MAPGTGAPLLIFQCQHCNAILGDSLSLVATDEELRTITLRGASSIVILEEQPRTYEEGKAAGSTFLTIKCKSCRTDVGGVFITTPRNLDGIRDLLSLDAQKISSYALGSPEVLASAPNDAPAPPAILDPFTSSAKILRMESELLKVENMILLHSERLDQLEGAGRDLPSTAGDEETNDRRGEGLEGGAQAMEEAKVAQGTGQPDGRLENPVALGEPGSKPELHPAGRGKRGLEADELPLTRQRRKGTRA
ncbi:hypothetical protein KFL_005300060 [Klebsormidium nitens]|uniref:Mis18 domain-containing protein n=1 Tax=Klebsormidium nitens TaxID=105231 RepID=A0A1Y1IHF6_KLENI|nr:hypothetical protein KFL_005300060 [Klebsormidium nitens]|eukprot:GAQ89502.1 hypothetical protein KFL_005300060 [Klebsormidium nitens]